MSLKTLKIPTFFRHGAKEKILIIVFNHSIKDKIWHRKTLKSWQSFNHGIKTKDYDYKKILSFQNISSMTIWKNFITKKNLKNEHLNEIVIIPRVNCFLNVKCMTILKF